MVLGDNTGKLLQAIYLSGTGVGPQVAFAPTTSTSIFAEPSASCAQLVDSSGDIYLSLSSTGGGCGPITKLTPNGSSYTQSTVPSSALSSQISIAVDGAGNVFIADTGNGRVLKETLFGGVYSESIIATSINEPRYITVDGNGSVYFIFGVYTGNPTYPYAYKETPSPSGTYTQSSVYLGLFQNPGPIAIDQEGDIFVSEKEQYLDGSGNPYFQYFVEEVLPNGNSGPSISTGNIEDVTKLKFIDATSNVYVTIGNILWKFTQGSESSIQTQMAVSANTWGIDGSGNFFQTVGPSVIKVNASSSPSLRFAETGIGSKSSDSPQNATLVNIGNAPLAFSVPNSGTNPSVAANFALDASSTCPQISVSSSPSSLAANNSCTYAVSFNPTTTGIISGSLIASDNALNAVGGTQTIPLSGSGTSGTSGNAILAVLAKGPGGVLQGVVVPNQSPAGAGGSSYNVWVDTTHHTFIQGAIYLQVDSQGNPTCNVYSSPTQLAATQTPQFGTLFFTTEQYYIPGCGTTLYSFPVAHYTWGSDQSVAQDPFTLKYSTQDLKYHNSYYFLANLARVTAAPAVQSGAGPNPPLTATVTLTNPPVGAVGYDWQIIGGNGVIVFPNGQETISSTTNSIPIDEPNPTPTSISFNIQVGIRYPSTLVAGTAADPLLYGPTPDTFCGASATVDVWVKDTAATTDDITVLNPAVSIPVQLTMHTNPSCGPQTLTLNATPAGRISFNQTTFNLADGGTANAVITPLAVSTSVNDITIATTVKGNQVGTANMTVADIHIPAVRNLDTPNGMPDRIPPRINTSIHVTITPDLGSSGQTIHLIPKNNNATNGDFTINGGAAQDLTTTTDVVLQGTQQTASSTGNNNCSGSPAGANANKLTIVAQVGGIDRVTSKGFSVAAIPQNYTETYVGPVNTPGYYGIIVQDGWSSDSGSIADLDQVCLSEQVQVMSSSGTLAGVGSSNSSYLSATMFSTDQHATPAQYVTANGGDSSTAQTNIFEDFRTGTLGIPMTNSGYTITRHIFLNSASNVWQITTTKVGAATSANGYASGAGQPTNPISLTQP